MKYRIGQKVKVDFEQIVNGWKMIGIGTIIHISDSERITIQAKVERTDGTDRYNKHTMVLSPSQQKYVTLASNKTQLLKQKLLRGQ